MADPGRITRLAIPILSSKPYGRKLVSLFGASSVIGLWPHTERSGTPAYDISSNGHNGTYGGVVLADTPGPRLKPAPKWDGVNDYCNVYSASLAAAFNPNAGTILAWAKVLNVDIWADGTNDFALQFGADGSNYVRIIKVAATLNFGANFNATNKSISLNPSANINWLQIGLTWSKAADQVKAFYNGAQTGATQTGLGTYTGAPAANQTAIGSQSSSGATPWNGWLAYAVLLNRVATPTEIASAYNLK